ncbi:MAG: DNA polymerase [Acidimicrobiales bacterium]
MNAGIQGLAADIFKVALVRLDHAVTEQGLGSRLILQVHDEVLLEVPPDEHDRAAELTVATLRGGRPRCPARGQPLLRLVVGRGQGLTRSPRSRRR